MLFSNIPPLEAAKLLCSMPATKRKSKRGKPLKLALFDMSRARFYRKAQREIYVTLPEGDDEDGKRALLLKTMYGTQDARHVWLDYTALLLDEKFEQGKAWTTVFTHKEQDIKLLVHGDDFFFLADQEGQDYTLKVLAKKYDFGCDGMIRPDHSDDSHLTISNRSVFDKNARVVSYEAGPRHAHMMVRELQLENAKAAATPAEKKKLADVISASGPPQLDGELRRLHCRSLVMRAQFLARDRADLSEAVKGLTRKEATHWR